MVVNMDEYTRLPLPRFTEYPCRICRGTDGCERHHLIGRKKIAGQHITVPLCTGCHDAVHGELGIHEKIIARRKLRLVLTDREIKFIVETMGPKYLRRKYPSRLVRVPVTS